MAASDASSVRSTLSVCATVCFFIFPKTVRSKNFAIGFSRYAIAAPQMKGLSAASTPEKKPRMESNFCRNI